MPSDPYIPNTIEALLPIYDTMTDQSRWGATLDVVAASIGAVGGGLYTRMIDENPYEMMAMGAPYTVASFAEYKANRFDELEADQWDYLGRQPVLTLVHDDETGIPRHVLDEREDYRFNRDRWGIGRRVATRLNSIASWYDATIFVFSATQTEVPDASLRALRPLLPHLAKAVDAGRAFTLLRQRYQAALAALDHVLVGLAIALPSGEVILRNEEAKRILSDRDGLMLGRDGHFASHDPKQRLAFDAGIRAAAATLRGGANSPERLLLVPRPSGRRAYLVEFSPLTDSGGEVERGLEGALVTIVDPDGVPPASVRRFAVLHGLTPAETEVCTLLVEGATREEIAEHRRTRPTTVACQIESIMAKCGARRRGQLIRLIYRTVPPVR